jgi:hypothetical protein
MPVTDWNAFTREWIAARGLEGTTAVLLRGPSSGPTRTNHALELVELAERAS